MHVRLHAARERWSAGYAEVTHRIEADGFEVVGAVQRGGVRVSSQAWRARARRLSGLVRREGLSLPLATELRVVAHDERDSMRQRTVSIAAPLC